MEEGTATATKIEEIRNSILQVLQDATMPGITSIAAIDQNEIGVEVGGETFVLTIEEA